MLSTMICNHFPSSFCSPHNWMTLAWISACAVLVRHCFNTRHNRHMYAWTLSVGALGIAGLAYISTPTPATTLMAAASARVSFEKIHNVIRERCAVCHSATPTSPLFSTAPAGVMFDTPQQIREMAPRIQAQAVTSQIMPLGNITQMTQEERKLIDDWITQGAQAH